MKHHHLAGGVWSGAYANDRDLDGLGDLFGKRAGYAFQQQHTGPGILQLFGFIEDGLCLISISALYENPPMRLIDWGVNPICAHTGMPRSASSRVVLAIHAPPSSLTIWPPARISEAAFSNVCTSEE